MSPAPWRTGAQAFWRVPWLPGGVAGAERAAPLPPFRSADGTGIARYATEVRLSHDDDALHVLFVCQDPDPWGTYTRRDDPVYLEEAVELFLAPGRSTPATYFEFEVSPRGTLFDARVSNPKGERASLAVDPRWDCPGLVWGAEPNTDPDGWRAWLSIPWSAVSPPGPRPSVWRANFFRIERSRGGEAELTCWSPTLTDPPDFHRPERFGFLETSGH